MMKCSYCPASWRTDQRPPAEWEKSLRRCRAVSGPEGGEHAAEETVQPSAGERCVHLQVLAAAVSVTEVCDLCSFVSLKLVFVFFFFWFKTGGFLSYFKSCPTGLPSCPLSVREEDCCSSSLISSWTLMDSPPPFCFLSPLPDLPLLLPVLLPFFISRLPVEFLTVLLKWSAFLLPNMSSFLNVSINKKLKWHILMEHISPETKTCHDDLIVLKVHVEYGFQLLPHKIFAQYDL